MSSTTAWALLGVVILFISGGITYWVITIYQRKNQELLVQYGGPLPMQHISNLFQLIANNVPLSQIRFAPSASRGSVVL
ncbi:hypothetical protein Vi05172_g5902 [Venturia inaequalis]|nr:hypothetical protein Vi05172_g5902 [Venturia inaequalis]